MMLKDFLFEVNSVAEDVIVRGTVAFKIATNKYISNIDDLDIIVDNEDSFKKIYNHLLTKYGRVKIKEFQYINDNIPRKRIEITNYKNKYTIDVLIESNFYYLSHTTVIDFPKVKLLSIPDFIAEIILGISNTKIAIDPNEFGKKFNILVSRLLSIFDIKKCYEISKCINHQLISQNKYYQTKFNLYDILFQGYSGLKTMRDLNNSDSLTKVLNIFKQIAISIVDSEKHDKIFFYDHEESFGCLSNFSNHNVTYDNLNWSSAEHCYQAQKFIDYNDKIEIFNQKTAKSAALLARSKNNYRQDWDFVKTIKMYNIIKSKTLQNSEVFITLLATDNKEILENSPKDDFWGVGKNKDGQNVLGKLFMSIRKEIF